MMRKVMVNVLMIILCITVFTGCSSRKEVRERAFVQAVAVETQRDGNLSVAVRVFDDEETYFGNGEDFFMALDDAQQQQAKYFFTGHMEMLISSAEDNIKLLESLIKSNDIPPSCRFISGQRAMDIISDADCDRLAGIIKIKSESGNALGKSIWNVLEELTDKGYADTDLLNRQGIISVARVSAKD